MAKQAPKTQRIVFESIGLQTARGRLAFFGFMSILIYLLPIKILGGLSIWQKLGIDAPSIGLTRAYHYVIHGEIDRARHQNVLIFLVLAIGVPLITKDVYNVIKQLTLRSRNGRSRQ